MPVRLASVTPTVAIALALTAVVGCSPIQADWQAGCDITDINSLFASPLEFEGQRFCGRGFLYASGELAGVYPEPVQTMSDGLDQAILFAADSGRSLPTGRNTSVLVSGRIDAASCNSDPDPESACVPVAHAIILEDWDIRASE